MFAESRPVLSATSVDFSTVGKGAVDALKVILNTGRANLPIGMII